MALDQSALLEVLDALRTADAGERINQACEVVYQALIDAELGAKIGAALHERTETRTDRRNGSRPRSLSMVAGDLQLRIPQLRSGVVLPGAAGAAPPGGSVLVRGGDGGLPARHLDA
ncbi:transposase [Mycobacterium marinum]|uniref:transposase n=1 Tax=Mycobacterium marinum TaxID=1781 RepID=UPI00402986F3